MPIVDVELVAAPGDRLAEGLAQSLADVVGRTLQSPAGQTWVRVRVLAREHYAENASPVPETDLPVFVTVLKLDLPERAQSASEIPALTRAVAGILGRAESCVHVEYAPAARGRLAFGGKLIE